MSFSVATITIPSATSGSPNIEPSNVADVQTRLGGKTRAPELSTPLDNPFP